MRILYFDCWSPRGHHKFNTIHLRALGHIGEVGTIIRHGELSVFDLPNVNRVMDIPEEYFLDHSSSFKSRVLQAKMMRYISNRIKPEEWDFVILASYDAISTFISQRFKNAFVIDHNTIADLDNPVKGWFFRHLSKGITHVVFNDEMKKKLNDNGIYNCVVVPHGLLPMNCHKSEKELDEFYMRYHIATGEKIIFIPSLSRVSEDMIGEFIYNSGMNEFLKEHNLILFTKSQIERSSLSNIRIINGFLPQADYELLFTQSICNILLYSSAFRYRTSGVLNECFANNIPCVIINNKALTAYRSYIANPLAVFSSIDELKASILSVLNWDKCRPYYVALEEISDPLEGWKKVLLKSL